MLSIGSSSSTIVTNPVGGAAEAILASTPLVSIPKDAVSVIVLAFVTLQIAASVTGVTLKLLRGVTAGANVIQQTASLALAAVSNQTLTIMGIDTIIGFAQAQWSMSIVETGSTGNSNINAVTIAAIFLS